MSAITLDLPDDLAERLRLLADRLPHVLALGIHELDGTSEVLEFLATLPSPEETLALRPSPRLQARMTELLEKNRTSGLTPRRGKRSGTMSTPSTSSAWRRVGLW